MAKTHPARRGRLRGARVAGGKSKNMSRSGRLHEAESQRARMALVGKTLADVRNVMVEGLSGLLSVHPPNERPLFEPSKRRLTWPNGAIAELFSADEAEGLRGPQFSAAWCDELAKWRGAEKAWDMLQFALRLGETPRACVTTTPRATTLLKKIIADEATVTVKLATADNATNLGADIPRRDDAALRGSTIGRQELLGEIVDGRERRFVAAALDRRGARRRRARDAAHRRRARSAGDGDGDVGRVRDRRRRAWASTNALTFWRIARSRAVRRKCGRKRRLRPTTISTPTAWWRKSTRAAIW